MDINILILLLAVATIIGIAGFLTRVVSLIIITGISYTVLGTIVAGFGIDQISGKIIDAINNTSTVETITYATTNNINTNLIGVFLIALGLILMYFFVIKGDAEDF